MTQKIKRYLFLKKDSTLKKYLLLLPLVLLSGCSDNAITMFYDKEFSKPPCLKLVVFPPDDMLIDSMKDLYEFEKTCEYKLQVSKKGGITCNSIHNAGKKTTSNFPSGYLKMDITKDSKRLYSYYIDITNTLTKSDVKDGFNRVKEDLQLD